MVNTAFVQSSYLFIYFLVGLRCEKNVLEFYTLGALTTSQAEEWK